MVFLSSGEKEKLAQVERPRAMDNRMDSWNQIILQPKN